MSLPVLGRTTLVLLSVLMIQTAVLSDMPALGAIADLMLLVAIAAGSVGGPDRGAAIGFAAGIAYDLMLETPFGLSPLSYAVAGYAAGWAVGWVLHQRWWAHALSAAAISVVAVLLYVVAARVVGTAYSLDDVLRMMVVVAAWNAVLILPARRVLRWVFGEEEAGSLRMAVP